MGKGKFRVAVRDSHANLLITALQALIMLAHEVLHCFILIISQGADSYLNSVYDTGL